MNHVLVTWWQHLPLLILANELTVKGIDIAMVGRPGRILLPHDAKTLKHVKAASGWTNDGNCWAWVLG